MRSAEVPGALIHEAADDVAIIITDVSAGDAVPVTHVTTDELVDTVTASEAIGFGHKIAMRDLENGHEIREYGGLIGTASMPIRRGDRVHVHNLRSVRW